ncbi:MAG: hypothetical protein M0R66_02450 [Candidatus Omnitrophica bacterium]|nr:hypothetical protein [Candidatus Omnitrophota bacterium]
MNEYEIVMTGPGVLTTVADIVSHNGGVLMGRIATIPTAKTWACFGLDGKVIPGEPVTKVGREDNIEGAADRVYKTWCEQRKEER